MRVRTMSIAAAVALGVASPGWANEYVGTVEAGVGYSLIDQEFANVEDDNYFLVEGVGRGNIPLSDTVALQLDAGGLATFGNRDGAGEDYLQTVYFGAAHLNYRTPDYALGVLAHVGSANGGADENANFYNFGAEGLYNLSDLTLIAQAGYFWADDEDFIVVMTDAWWARLVARFYLGENTRFQAEGSYGDGENAFVDECPLCGPGDVTVYGWGARVDHAWNDGPVAVYVGYRANWIQDDFGSPTDTEILDHTVSLGLNLRFGADSLKAADRDGPAFDTPDIGRWTGWTTAAID